MDLMCLFVCSEYSELKSLIYITCGFNKNYNDLRVCVCVSISMLICTYKCVQTYTVVSKNAMHKQNCLYNLYFRYVYTCEF